MRASSEWQAPAGRGDLADWGFYSAHLAFTVLEEVVAILFDDEA